MSLLRIVSHRIKKIAVELSDEPTQDMVDFFEARTKKHIDRVNVNVRRIAEKYPELNFSYDHDASKYSKDEKIPYIWLTEYYRQPESERVHFKYPAGMEEKIDRAVEHHYKNNPHHVEFHSSPQDMSKKDLVEMVADWGAMSQERGPLIKIWANKETPKMSLSKEQEAFVYKLINVLE